MSSISLYYGSQQICPTPTISQNYNFTDYNATRWGSVNEITLAGTISGIAGTGAVNQITNIFSQQFLPLTVYQVNPSGLIYNFPNIIVQSIEFPTSHFYQGTALNYIVKCLSYNEQSGIIDPINEYSFTQNTDQTVNVSHRISARGIKGVSGSLSNAISFVKNFTGQQPFQYCSSFLIPNSTGILLKLNERIDRANGTYSVEELYRYNTGANTNYIQLSTLSVNDSMGQAYLTLDYSTKFQGSPIQNDLVSLGNSIKGWSALSDISSMGYATGLMVQTSSEIVRDSGAA